MGLKRITLGTDLYLATASNFLPVMKKIVSQFELETGKKVTIISGSSGRLYAQILNGSPADLFFSANQQYTRDLEEKGIAVKGSRYVYARGRLVLLYSNVFYKTILDSHQEITSILRNKGIDFLAIAHPGVAPYGFAAMQTVDNLSLLEHLKPKLVRGESVSQAFHFVKSGQAQLGFVSLSLVVDVTENGQEAVFFSVVPPAYHDPIEQEMVLITTKTLGARFLTFIKSDAIRQLIRVSGYEI